MIATGKNTRTEKKLKALMAAPPETPMRNGNKDARRHRTRKLRFISIFQLLPFCRFTALTRELPHDPAEEFFFFNKKWVKEKDENWLLCSVSTLACSCDCAGSVQNVRPVLPPDGRNWNNTTMETKMTDF